MPTITSASTGITRAFREGASVLRRHTADRGERCFDQLRKNRHVIGFALREAPRHPMRFQTATRAYNDTLARQTGLLKHERVDTIADAIRHTGASSLVVDRLARTGTPIDVAADFMRRLGHAHERDSRLTGAYRAASERMDLHNNELGITVARERFVPGPSTSAGEQALEGAVLRALADGRGLVLDAPTVAPRASTAAEVRAILNDVSRLPPN